MAEGSYCASGLANFSIQLMHSKALKMMNLRSSSPVAIPLEVLQANTAPPTSPTTINKDATIFASQNKVDIIVL